MVITDLQRDAICELINIGMGRASMALGKMIGDRITLTIPTLELVDQAKVCAMLDNNVGSAITAVKERFSGALQGDAILIFPEAHSLELVRSLLADDDMSIDSLTEMESESLLEIGNIVLNACLGTFNNILEFKLNIDLPIMCRGSIARILGGSASAVNMVYLLMRIDFRTEKKMINGHLLFLVESDFATTFIGPIDSYIAQSIA